MAILVDGSKMRTDAFYGQNGSNTPSSIQKNETIKRSAVAKTIIAGDGSVTAAPGDWQTRNVSAAPIKTNPGTKGASAGPKIGLSNVRRANGLILPTRR